MKKSAFRRALTLLLSGVLTAFSLVSCQTDSGERLGTTAPPTETTVTTAATTPSVPKDMTLAELREFVLTCQQITVKTTVYNQATGYVYFTVKRNGHKIMVEKKTEKSNASHTLTKYTTSTTYYDLEKRETYYHDEKGNYYIDVMKESTDWNTILVTSVLNGRGKFAFKDENYDITEDAYLLNASALAEFAPASCTFTRFEFTHKKTAEYKIYCSYNRINDSTTEGSGEASFIFSKPLVKFPDAQRAGSSAPQV